MRVMHIVSGDLWAGAEVSAYHLLTEMSRREDLTVTAIVLNAGTLASRLSSAGVETTVLPEAEIPLGKLVLRLLRVSKTWRPDVIHTHRFKEHVLGAVVGALRGAFHVRSAHGLSPTVEWDGGLEGLGGLLDEALANLTGATWIAVSRDLARHLSGLRQRVRVVPNGLPQDPPRADRASLERAFADDRPCWLVGFAGRLEPVKRPDRFVRVMSRLPDELAGRQVRGVVLGDGSLRPAVERQVRDAGLAERIRLLGHRDGADALVAALDLLIIPSDHEGHPMVLLEAMRSGIPVVATGVGGLPEVLGDSPWLGPAEDEALVADLALRLLRDAPVRRDWGKELRRRFLERFSVEKAADSIVQVYRSGLEVPV